MIGIFGGLFGADYGGGFPIQYDAQRQATLQQAAAMAQAMQNMQDEQLRRLWAGCRMSDKDAEAYRRWRADEVCGPVPDDVQ